MKYYVVSLVKEVPIGTLAEAGCSMVTPSCPSMVGGDSGDKPYNLQD